MPPEMTTSFKVNKNVESMLVCTGVYQKQCDLHWHLNSLFNEKSKDARLPKESTPNTNMIDMDSNVPNLIATSDEQEADIKIEDGKLKNLLSRRNSFISYFDNKLNIPDLTFENLNDAADYIVKNETY
jgi:hypothetical protein